MSNCAQLALQLRAINSLLQGLKSDVEALKKNSNVFVSNFKEHEQSLLFLGKAIESQRKSLDAINQVLASQQKINKSTEYKFGKVIEFNS